jgi:phage terminase large subunit GpA-like protein
VTQPQCKHCNLPIRETHQGRVRNEWEHMNGLSFCADGKNWAWPIAKQPEQMTLMEVYGHVDIG